MNYLTATNQELVDAAQEGDVEARNEAVVRNMGLAIGFAKRFKDTHPRAWRCELGDLIQAGAIGLVRAVMKFDKGRKRAFSTYAYYWIRAFNARCIWESCLWKIPEQVMCSFNRGDYDGEINEQQRRTLTAIKKFQEMELTDKIEHLVGAGREALPEDVASRAEVIEAVREAVLQLSPRQQFIIDMVMDDKTPSDIGRALGTHRCVARKWRDRAFAELRETLKGVAA
jgi:RNA polymerase sigma factor (sigma-70 family)